MDNSGIQACDKADAVPPGSGTIWPDLDANSILARQGQADEKLFQDDLRVERAASFEVKVGPKEPGWKLVHPAWSEVGMLSPGLFDGEGRHTG